MFFSVLFFFTFKPLPLPIPKPNHRDSRALSPPRNPVTSSTPMARGGSKDTSGRVNVKSEHLSNPKATSLWVKPHGQGGRASKKQQHTERKLQLMARSNQEQQQFQQQSRHLWTPDAPSLRVDAPAYVPSSTATAAVQSPVECNDIQFSVLYLFTLEELILKCCSIPERTAHMRLDAPSFVPGGVK